VSRACSTHGTEEECMHNFGGKPRGKDTLGRSGRRREDNIKVDLRQIGWGGVEWIHLAQNRDQWRALVSTVMNILVP
jgi:hypothetical protein